MAFVTKIAMPKVAALTPLAGAYTACAAVALTVHHVVAGGAFSSILTMSVIVQCLGVAFLCIQVLSTGSASGISAGSLKLDALAIVLRLSSTTWLEGYLPVDASGDYIYQTIDVCSLLLLLWLLHRVLVVDRATYQVADDTVPIGPMVLVSLALAALLHGDMDDNRFFDTLWMAGLFSSVVAVLPQLYLIVQSGGRTEALTSHYIAALALSRALSGAFMWHARFDITCAPLVTGFSHAIYAILAAHAVHLALLGDFAYHYGRAVYKKGLQEPVDLSEPLWV